MSQKVLSKVASSAFALTGGQIDAARRKRYEIAREMQRIQALSAGLLGIEKTSLEALNRRANDLRAERDGLTQCANVGAQVCERYKMLSLNPLSVRDEQGLPALVIWGLESPDFSVRFSTNTGVVEIIVLAPKNLPSALARCFDDLHVSLGKTIDARRGGTVTITCRFSGLIPARVKSKIEEARSYFGDDIFIIGEPGVWQKDVVVNPEPDPLVVGYRDGALWLIATFDITPLEAAIVDGLRTEGQA